MCSAVWSFRGEAEERVRELSSAATCQAKRPRMTDVEAGRRHRIVEPGLGIKPGASARLFEANQVTSGL